MQEKIWEFLSRKELATSLIGKIVYRFKKPSSPPLQVPLTARAIYSYITELDKNDRDRFYDERIQRGLSFGDLHVDGAGIGMRLTARYARDKNFSAEEIYRILCEIAGETSGAHVLCDGDECIVLLMQAAPKHLAGVWRSGWSKSRGTYNERVFLEVGQYAGHELFFEIYSAEALEMAFLFARRLGFATEPAMYANESDVPLEQIVEYAYHWYDSTVKKHYAEMKYDIYSQKSLSYGGRYEDFEENGKKVIVLASSDSIPKFRLNNIEVPMVKVRLPTKFILMTRDLIRSKERERNTCKIDECGRDVAFEVSVTRWEINTGVGISSGGSTFRVCDREEHVEKVKEASKGIRTTVRSVRKEVW